MAQAQAGLTAAGVVVAPGDLVAAAVDRAAGEVGYDQVLADPAPGALADLVVLGVQTFALVLRPGGYKPTEQEASVR